MTTHGGNPMDSGDLAELALLLRAERPEPDVGWAARLDQRAAAGFPRGGGSGGSRRPSRRPGGWMAPAGGLAALLLVVVVVAVNQGDSTTGTSDSASSSDAALSTTVAPESSGESFDADGEMIPFQRDSAGAADLSYGTLDAGRAAKIAPGTENRRVDRDAQLTLSAQPDDVRGVSDEVISITRSLDGVVENSQISETKDGASATLQLTIPTRNLDAALDRMTELADVDSLNETATDITRPVVDAKDELRDANARRRELLQALGNATTTAEADALEQQIADARKDIARAEAAYEKITLKARLSSLDVTVQSNPEASSQRTIGDWLDDAVDVLRTLAGVLLVTLAIVVAVALIAGIVAFVVSRVRRRRRERALDA